MGKLNRAVVRFLFDRIDIELRNLAALHSRARHPLGQMYFAKVMHVYQKPSDARPGGWTRRLERVADKDDAVA